MTKLRGRTAGIDDRGARAVQVPGQQGLPPYPGLGQYPGAPFMGQQGYGAPQPGQGYSVGHEQQLRGFWQEQLREVHQVPCDPAEFKNHQLPLARIKKASAPAQCGARQQCLRSVIARAKEMCQRSRRSSLTRSVGLCSLTQIMKSDEDVRMISAEAPVLFAKVRLCWTVHWQRKDQPSQGGDTSTSSQHARQQRTYARM